MEKTVLITLNSQVFNITEKAYAALKDYLDSIRRHYADSDSAEILGDIEASIADKFSGMLSERKNVIDLVEVEKIIGILGKVEDFDDEATEPETSEHSEEKKDDPVSSVPKKLYRDTDDVIIAGVCSGIAAYFGIDPVFTRIIFVLLVFADGIGIIAYLILWLVMPKAVTASQKLEMKGKETNIKALEEKIKKESKGIRDGFKGRGGAIKQILKFPFQVLKELINLFKKLLSAFWPLISILAGSLIILSSVIGIGFLSFFASAALFRINSQLFVSDIDLAELGETFVFKLAAVSLYFVILVPLVFVLLFGLTWMRRRNAFKFLASSLLVGLWMMALVSLGLAAIDLVPEIRKSLDDAGNQALVVRQYNDLANENFRISVNGRVNVVKGDEHRLFVKGDEKALENIRFENSAEELHISQSAASRGICIFCRRDRPIEMDISVPNLESFKIYGNTIAAIDGFYEEDFRANAGGGARLNINARGGKISSYIAQVGHIEITGSPDYLDLEMEDSAYLTALGLNTQEVTLRAQDHIRVTFAGETQNLLAELADQSYLLAYELDANSVDISLKGQARAEVSASSSLKALIRDNGRAYYRGEADKIEKTEIDLGKLLKEDEAQAKRHLINGQWYEESPEGLILMEEDRRLNRLDGNYYYVEDGNYERFKGIE